MKAHPSRKQVCKIPKSVRHLSPFVLEQCSGCNPRFDDEQHVKPKKFGAHD